jgi:hypothetical protein
MAYYDLTWKIQVNKIMPPILRNREIIPDDGNFKIGDPDSDYVVFIIMSSPGHWKETPDIGVNIYKYLQGTDSPQTLKREIKLHLEADVIKSPYINVDNFPEVMVNGTIFSQE